MDDSAISECQGKVKPRGATSRLFFLAAVAAVCGLFVNSYGIAQTHSWTNGVSGNWGDSSNWTPVEVPNDPGHWALIGVSSPTPYTVTLDLNVTLAQFDLLGDNAIFRSPGARTFTVDGPSTLGPASGSAVTWIGSTWAGAGLVTNNVDFSVQGSATIENLMNAGNLEIQGNPTLGTGQLTVANSMTNSGQLQLNSVSGSWSSNLNMGVGETLTNAGTFEIASGTGGGRSFNGALFNDATGTLTVDANATFGTGPITNLGSLSVASGQRLTLSSGIEFEQDNGSIYADGSILLPSGVFRFDGGTVSGTVILRAAALEIGAASTGAATFRFEGTGNTLTGDLALGQLVGIEGNSTLGTAAVTAGGPFTSAGQIILESTGWAWKVSVTMTGSDLLTNIGIIDILEGSGGARVLTGALQNDGSINVAQDTTFVAGPITNNGTFDIAAGKTLTISSDMTVNQAAGNMYVNGTYLQTNGTLNLQGGSVAGIPVLRTNCTLDYGAGFTTPGEVRIEGFGNSVIGDLEPGQTLHVQGNSLIGNTNVTAAGAFINGGTIRIDSTGSNWTENFTVTNNDLLTNTGTVEFLEGSGGGRTFTGALQNDGSINVAQDTTFVAGPITNNGTFDIAAGKALTILSNMTVNQAGGTLNVNGTYFQTNGTLNLQGGTVIGIPVLRSNCSLDYGAGFTTPVEVRIEGLGNNATGNLEPGQTLHIQGNSSIGNASVAAAGPFTNGGTIRIDSASGNWAETLTVNGGALLNTGLLLIEKGSGGPRTLNLELDNQGTTEISTNLTLGATGHTHRNTGAFLLKANAPVVTVKGDSFINEQGGIISGTGTIALLTTASDTLSNEGRLTPGGDGIGSLTLTGDMLQAPRGLIRVDINGLAVGTEHDLVNVSGTASLDGILMVRFPDPDEFTPSAGDRFTILTAGTVSGTFSKVGVFGLPEDRGAVLEYAPGSVTIVVHDGPVYSNVEKERRP